MKKRELFSVKNFNLELSDMDASMRLVSGYLAVFNTVDADGEVFKKGAFADSIRAKGIDSASNRKIAHLFNHDPSKPIGVFQELFEDDYGLKFVSKMGRSSTANDVFLNYQDGIIREHSVGFFYIQEAIKLNNDLDAYELSAVDLVEGSTVTFGANSLTRVLEVAKGLDKQEIVDEVNSEMDILIDAITKGQGTDLRQEDLELQLQIIKTKYNELVDLNSAKDLKKEIREEIKETDSNSIEVKQFYLHLLR